MTHENVFMNDGSGGMWGEQAVSKTKNAYVRTACHRPGFYLGIYRMLRKPGFESR
jgi:hypothetical protein